MLGLLHPSGTRVGVRQVEVCADVPGIDPHRLFQGGDRLGVTVERQVGEPERVVGVRQLGFQRDGPLEMTLGLLVQPAAVGDHTQVVMGRHHVGMGAKDLAQGVGGRTQLALTHVDPRQDQTRAGIVRMARQKADQQGLRLLHDPVLQIAGRQIRGGPRLRGVDLQHLLVGVLRLHVITVAERAVGVPGTGGEPGAPPEDGAPPSWAASPQPVSATRNSATARGHPRLRQGAIIRGRILANAGGRGYLPRMVRT